MGTSISNGTGTSPATVSVPWSTWSPGVLSPTSWQKRLTAAPIMPGSHPRSKRAEASLRKPRRLEVRAITIGVK